MSDIDLDALVLVAEQQAETATSYVEVELPDMPVKVQDPPEREFDMAVRVVSENLDAVVARLDLLRTERARINDEIRDLVAEEEVLRRMARVALAKKE